MATFAEQIPVGKRRRIQMWSIVANCFGALSEVMIDGSAFLISYMALLGGDESLTMLLAAATGATALILQIPSGLIVERIGLKKGMYLSCVVGCIACLLMSMAVVAGDYAKYVVIALCFAYCFSRPIFSASWFPIVDTFVAPNERGSYFGYLRFVYGIFAGVFFYSVGKMMGEKPPIGYLQALIATCAVLQFARAIFVYFLDLPKLERKSGNGIWTSLRSAIACKRLMHFSVFMLLVAMIAYLAQPLAITYLKQTLGYGVSTVQTVATLGMLGTILGNLVFGKLLAKLGSRHTILLILFGFVMVHGMLFFCGKGIPYLLEIIKGILLLNYTLVAWFFAYFSAEMYSVAEKDNIVMSLSLCNTIFSGGRMLSGLIPSMLLAMTFIPTSIALGDMEISKIQLIFAMTSCIALVWYCVPYVVKTVIPR